jgi:cell fate (sporulation/competence/biofilm development) regulator YlbF (YheA/YmcA/DUF963 family)
VIGPDVRDSGRVRRNRPHNEIDIMHTTTEDNTITLKTRELCQALLDEPQVQSIRERIDTFLGDESVRGKYDILMMKGEALQYKQNLNLPMTEEEIGEFEKLRDELMENSVARDFMQAQREMQKLQEQVNKYVAKAFELGRVPEVEDVDSGCCDSGCGCH